jgi:hypothetical protein
LTEGLRIEAGCDGDPTSIAQEELEGLSGGSGRTGGDGIGEDGDGEEMISGGGERIRRGGLGGGNPVEVFAEGMEGEAASLAELGLGQAAAAELVEEGVSA